MKTFSLFRAHLYRLSRSIWAWAVSAAFLAALCFALGGECLSVLLGVGQGVDVFGAWSNVLRAMPIPLAVFCPLFVGSELSCGGMRSKAAAGCEKGRSFGALLLVCFAYAAALYILSCALCYAFASLLGLNDCLEDSLTQFYVSFAERGIEPKIDICAARVERSYNKDALSRIFGNILSNAVRYSDGDLCVRLEETGRIEFENSASRLDEVSAGKLFDRFFTVENARGSAGLGLSIAKLLTERSGGKIDASWRAGRLKIVLSL